MKSSTALSLTAHPSVVFRELAGEAVLLHLDTGVYYGLDAVGTRVWTLLLAHGTAQAVCEQMQREYEVAADVVERDVRRLLGELRETGLLVESTPAG